MLTQLLETIAAGKAAYRAAEQRRDHARTALAKADGVVADAKSAHAALLADVVAGKSVTADQVGAALHKIAGAESLADIHQNAVAACEAEIEATLTPVATVLRRAVSAKAATLRAREASIRSQMADLHKTLDDTFRQANSLEYTAINIGPRPTALSTISAEQALSGSLDLSWIETQ